MKIVFNKNSLRKFEKDIENHISNRANAAIMAVYKSLQYASIYFVHQISTSHEWQELTAGRLIGEFGFAPYETSKFNDALVATIPSINDPSAYSNLEVLSRPGPGVKKTILNWIDWNRLAWSDIGQHKLTHWDAKQKSFTTTAVVSWLEWLEEGVIIMGHEYEENPPFSKKFFSRSGQGLMKEGALWSFAPTKLFERTANSFDTTIIQETFVKAMKKPVGRI